MLLTGTSQKVYTYIQVSPIQVPVHVTHTHTHTHTQGDAVTPKKGRRVSLKIIHRFHFSSLLKRMSVISTFVPAQTSGHTHLVTVKGAPEIVKEMVRWRNGFIFSLSEYFYV